MTKTIQDKMPTTPDLKEKTVAKLKGMEGIFICLEQALDTTKKWNLRAELGERLVAF